MNRAVYISFVTCFADKFLRKGRKYDAALDGAREVFLRDGFEGATVDDIARAGGVSKATLYRYFPDKSQMFVAVLAKECERQSSLIDADPDPDAPVVEVIAALCREMMGFLISDAALDMFRAVIADVSRFPELGRDFYDQGPAQMHQTLVAFLTCDRLRDELDIDDPDLAAEQLKMLCHVDIFLKKIFGIRTEPTQADIDRVANSAAQMFVARYGRQALRAAAE